MEVPCPGKDVGTRGCGHSGTGRGDAGTRGRDVGTLGRDAEMACGDGMPQGWDAGTRWGAGRRDSTPGWDVGPLGFLRSLIPHEAVLPTLCTPCSPLRKGEKRSAPPGPGGAGLPEELDTVWSTETGGHPGGADGQQGTLHAPSQVQELSKASPRRSALCSRQPCACSS